MRENWYRRALYASMGMWLGGVGVLAGGASAAWLALGPWWAGAAIGLGVGVLGGFLGARATYQPSIHDRLHGPVGVVCFAGVPIALLVAVLAVVVLGSTPSEGVTAALLGGAVVATVGGLAALLANLPLWKARLKRSSTVYASWSARQPPTQRRRTKYAVGALVVIAVGGGAAAFAVGVELETTWWAVFAPLPALLASVDSERAVEVRDAGVLVDSSLVAWGDYDAFELTDEALVLHRGSRYVDRAHRFDRDDVEDLDEGVRALERFLPRRES